MVAAAAAVAAALDTQVVEGIQPIDWLTFVAVNKKNTVLNRMKIIFINSKKIFNDTNPC